MSLDQPTFSQELSMRHAVTLLVGAAMIALVTPAAFADEPDEATLYLRNLLKGVRIAKTTQDAYGDVVDCVDIDHQPAMNSPHWSGSVHREMTTLGKSRFPGVIVPAPKSELCPEGTVEMRLPTHDQIVRAGGVRKFMAKHPRPDATASPQLQPGDLSGHYHAVTYGYKNVHAAAMTMDVWQPANIGLHDFSLGQMWISGGSGSSLQTIEAGFHSYPELFQGDGTTRFFIYATRDNYVVGCYNICDRTGFVKLTDVLPIGGYLPVSTGPNDRKEKTIVWFRDAGSGDWYLFLQNPDGTFSISGYYPVAFWQSGQMSLYGERVDFGGEIYSWSTSKPKTIMGNGANPARDAWPQVARMRNLRWMDVSGRVSDYASSGGVMVPSAPGAGGIFEGCAYGREFYSAGSFNNFIPNSGAVFLYGGRGYTNYYAGCQ